MTYVLTEAPSPHALQKIKTGVAILIFDSRNLPLLQSSLILVFSQYLCTNFGYTILIILYYITF